MTKLKRSTVRKLYLEYPHKYYDMFSSTVPDPYFPTSEISDHEYRLTCKQWMALVKMYFEEAERMLLEGKKVRITRVGTLVMLRKKGPVVNKQKTMQSKETEGEYTKFYYQNNHTGGYRPYLKWLRLPEYGCSLPYKSFYSFNLIRKTTWKRISNRLHKEPHLINNLQDYHEWVHTTKNSTEPSSSINS